MIDAILNFAVRQRMLIALGSLALAGFGILALKQIPIDAFPDVTNVQVQVIATAGGMSPPEVETLITRPIEMEMAGLPRLTQIRSVSKIGIAVITVVFEDGVNDYFARQLVSERLQSARENLPDRVDASLGPITTGLGEIFQYTLVSNDGKRNATELRTIQDYIVKPILRTVPGVTDVNSFGGFVKEYQVIIKPDRLTSYRSLCSRCSRPLRRITRTRAATSSSTARSSMSCAVWAWLRTPTILKISSLRRTNTLRFTYVI